MKIFISGSMAFAKEMVRVQKELKDMDHDVMIPDGTEPHLKDDKFVDNLEENLDFCIKNNVMRKNFKLVSESDAVLVLNNNRNGIEGYIGASALMEMGIAHHFNKKIFLFNQPPHYNDVRWAHEVAIMQPIVINGELNRII